MDLGLFTALVNRVNVKITRAGRVLWVTTSDKGFWDRDKAVSPSTYWFFSGRIVREQKSCDGIAVPCTENTQGGEARPSGAIHLQHNWEHQVSDED